jgi:hypothetical protein
MKIANRAGPSSRRRRFYLVIGAIAAFVFSSAVIIATLAHCSNSSTWACQHTKLADFDVIFELLAHNPAVFVACKLRQLIEVLVD